MVRIFMLISKPKNKKPFRNIGKISIFPQMIAALLQKQLQRLRNLATLSSLIRAAKMHEPSNLSAKMQKKPTAYGHQTIKLLHTQPSAKPLDLIENKSSSLDRITKTSNHSS